MEAALDVRVRSIASTRRRGRAVGYQWIVNLVDRGVEVHREVARPGPAQGHWRLRGDGDARRQRTSMPLHRTLRWHSVADVLLSVVRAVPELAIGHRPVGTGAADSIDKRAPE